MAGLKLVPGAVAVGFVNRLPVLGGDNTSVTAFENPEQQTDFASYRMVTEGYFQATGVALVGGRLLACPTA